MSAAALSCLMFMMTADNIRVIIKFAGEEIFHCRIRTAAHAAIKTDSCISKRILRPAANAAANQHVDCITAQDTGQCSMTLAIGANDFAFDDLSILSFIHLEFL